MVGKEKLSNSLYKSTKAYRKHAISDILFPIQHQGTMELWNKQCNVIEIQKAENKSEKVVNR